MMARVYRHRGDIVWYLMVVLLATAIAWLAVQVIDLRSEADGAAEAAGARQTAVDVLAEDVRVLREQVAAAGEEPAAPAPEERVEDLPQVEVPAPTPPVAVRSIAPTAAQVQAAVAAVFTANPQLPEDQVVAATTAWLTANPPAPGRDGTNGEPGRPPTAEENFIAVSAYCANDACRGQDGADGVDGEDAPPLTDDQILAQVAAYCDAHGECQGRPGRDGTDGEDGRGVVAVACRGDDLIFTFDQPPLEDVIADGCRPDPQPTEPPEPTVPPTSTTEP